MKNIQYNVYLCRLKWQVEKYSSNKNTIRKNNYNRENSEHLIKNIWKSLENISIIINIKKNFKLWHNTTIKTWGKNVYIFIHSL